LLTKYAYAREALNPRFPEPLGKELDVSIFFDSDHAHDKVTGRLISGITVYVGSTPILWRSKRQGAIQTSMYGAEFSSMKSATEEAIMVRYMLRSLGIGIHKPSNILGDNAGVISCASTPESSLKKKHIALSYHFIRENLAIGAIRPQHIPDKNNISDLFTKPLDWNTFMQHTNKVLSLNASIDQQEFLRGVLTLG
jgi:hypothetical protein